MHEMMFEEQKIGHVVHADRHEERNSENRDIDPENTTQVAQNANEAKSTT